MKTKNKIIIVISVVALVLLTVIGSYAYITANKLNEESESTMMISGGTMDIVFDGGSPILVGTKINPSSVPFITKNFVLNGTNNTGQKMPYIIRLVIDINTFSSGAISYTLDSTNTAGNGLIVPSITNTPITTSGYIDLGNGYFENVTDAAHNYTIKLYFLNTNENQSVDMEKTISTHVEILPGAGY